MTMPIGSSAGATRVRLAASASSSRVAPSNAEAGREIAVVRPDQQAQRVVDYDTDEADAAADGHG